MTHLALSLIHQQSEQSQYPELELPLDGRYQIIQVLSEKTWQRTYLAQDLRRPSQPECLIHQLRVLQEIPDYLLFVRHLFTQAASGLEEMGKHGQMPALLAYFENEAGFYVVHEWIKGTPVRIELASEKPWSEERVLEFLLQTLKPLTYAHERGILHGNLKPDTVIRRSTDRQLTLVNFSSVESLQLSVMGMHNLTIPVELKGTTGYEAPEQIQGLPGLASDVYALGMMAIHGLTGVHPMQFKIAPTTGETHWQSFHASAYPACSEGLVHILTQMVHYDPEQRYPSAKEALQALQFLTHAIAEGTVPALMTHSGSTLFPDTEPSSPPLIQALRRPQVSIGIAASLTAALAIGSHTLLASPQWANLDKNLLDEATEQYQAGQLKQALALAGRISLDSPNYARAQAAIAHWKKEWQTAQTHFTLAQQARSRQRWAAVLESARKIPAIQYWQKQMAPLVRQAIIELEQVGQKQLQQAYRHATQRNFTAAIVALQQVPDGTAVSPVVQKKLAEYQEKEDILATHHLQKALNLAYTGNFDGAIPYLYQIPKGTPAHAIAQRKLQEYQEKKQIQRQAIIAPRSQPVLISTSPVGWNPGEQLVEVPTIQSLSTSPSVPMSYPSPNGPSD